MREELELQLVKKYPKIFRNYKGDPTKTCMAWGMTCGNGWYDILDRCCEELSQFEGVYAEQVKEKFGGLRFYLNIEAGLYDNNPDLWKKLHEITGKAEAASFETCEDCGKPNDKRRSFHGWIHGICQECFDKMKAERVKFVCSCGRECTEFDGDQTLKLCWACKGEQKEDNR